MYSKTLHFLVIITRCCLFLYIFLLQVMFLLIRYKRQIGMALILLLFTRHIYLSSFPCARFVTRYFRFNLFVLNTL